MASFAKIAVMLAGHAPSEKALGDLKAAKEALELASQAFQTTVSLVLLFVCQMPGSEACGRRCP